MKTEDKKPRNLAMPRTPMSKDEFVAMIKEAEKGKFSPIEDSIKRLNEWRLNKM